MEYAGYHHKPDSDAEQRICDIKSRPMPLLAVETDIKIKKIADFSVVEYPVIQIADNPCCKQA